MLPKPHHTPYSTLVGMTMKQLLQLVKDHHLSSLLGVYKRLQKTGLVNALRKYEKTVTATATPKKKIKSPPPSPPKRPPPSPPKDLVNKPKKRITPMLIVSKSAEPFGSKGPDGVVSYSKVVASIAKKAAAMDKDKRGKKLISNSPVRRSARIKTINKY
jgi:hypothetical protein